MNHENEKINPWKKLLLLTVAGASLSAFLQCYHEFDEIPQAPQLITPPHQAILESGTGIELEWENPIVGVESTKVLLNEEELIHFDSLENESPFEIGIPLENGIYHWEVIVENDFQKYPSDVFEFSVCEPFAIAPQALIPRNGHRVNNPNLTLEFSPADPQPETYELWVNGHYLSSFPGNETQVNLSSNQIPFRDSCYMDWKIKAKNTCGIKNMEIESDPATFSIPEVLSTPDAIQMVYPEHEATVINNGMIIFQFQIHDHSIREADLFINDSYQTTHQITDGIQQVEVPMNTFTECYPASWKLQYKNSCSAQFSVTRSFTLIPSPDAYPDRTDLTEIENAYQELSQETGGYVTSNIQGSGACSMSRVIQEIIREEAVPGSDITFLIDNTGSMSPYLDDIKLQLSEIIAVIQEIGEIHLSAATYSDNNYPGNWFESTQLHSNFDPIISFIQGISLGNGGDLPESTYDALVQVIQSNEWQSSENRMILIITDALPHTESTRTNHSLEDVHATAFSEDIQINFYPILP